MEEHMNIIPPCWSEGSCRPILHFRNRKKKEGFKGSRQQLTDILYPLTPEEAPFYKSKYPWYAVSFPYKCKVTCSI